MINEAFNRLFFFRGKNGGEMMKEVQRGGGGNLNKNKQNNIFYSEDSEGKKRERDKMLNIIRNQDVSGVTGNNENMRWC